MRYKYLFYIFYLSLLACNDNPNHQTKYGYQLRKNQPKINANLSEQCDSILEHLSSCQIIELMGPKGENYCNCYDKFYSKLIEESGVEPITKFSYSTVGLIIHNDDSTLPLDILRFKNVLQCK